MRFTEYSRKFQVLAARTSSLTVRNDREIRISKLSFVEMQSAFAKVRSGALSRIEAGVDVEAYGMTFLHYFASADPVLSDVAAAEGLPVLNPGTP